MERLTDIVEQRRLELYRQYVEDFLADFDLKRLAKVRVRYEVLKSIAFNTYVEVAVEFFSEDLDTEAVEKARSIFIEIVNPAYYEACEYDGHYIVNVNNEKAYIVEQFVCDWRLVIRFADFLNYLKTL